MNKLLMANIICCTGLLSNAALCQQLDPPYYMTRLRPGETVRLEGFLDYRGEIIFYTSEKARRLRLVFPYCISAFSNLSTKQIVDSASYKVKVDAEVLGIEPDKDSDGISTSMLVAGNFIKNWCFGTMVLKILTINKAE